MVALIAAPTRTLRAPAKWCRAAPAILAVFSSGCGGYEVAYPRGAEFCVIRSYGDQLHPALAAAFRAELLALEGGSFRFLPEEGCNGAFVISTTFSPDPPTSCTQRGAEAGMSASGGGSPLLSVIVQSAVEAACKSYRAGKNVVFTEVLVIERDKGWKVDAKLWPPIERGAPAAEPAKQMAAELVEHLAEHRAD